MILPSNEVPKEDRRAFVEMIASQEDLTPFQVSDMHLCLSAGQALLAFEDGEIIGGIGYTHGTCPRTCTRCVIERMVYVRPEHRSSGLASYLVQLLEEHARDIGASVIYAGSSLSNHETTKRLYEAAGFTTTYSFRKEL